MPQRLPALALLCLLAFAFGSSAEARMIVELHGVDGPKYINTQPEIGIRKAWPKHRRGARLATAPAAASRVVAGRPRGCPHRHCGCSLSLKLFGVIKPVLNVAANWKGFRRTQPASGMVAARRGHVMLLESHVGGNVWMVYDPNSGRGLTRIHARSIAGFTIHDPHSPLVAVNGKPGRHYRTARRYRVARR